MNNNASQNKLREMIRILERKLGIVQENEFSCCGVSMAQCHALVEIGRMKRISLNDLSDLLNLDKSTMSRTVNNLVTNNLAQRDIDPEDRRYVTISLTDNGNILCKDIEDRMNAYYKSIYESIPNNKRNQVLESIEILLSAMGETTKL